MGAVDHKLGLKDLGKLWKCRNSTLNILTYCISFALAYLVLLQANVENNNWFYLLCIPVGFSFYLILLIIYDIFYYKLRISIIDENETLRQGYNFSLLIDDSGSATGGGLDYGFNFYDGNFEKDRAQAQLDKFEFAWKTLGLESGMNLIDFGCGCGDWLSYVKSRGVNCIGVNITEGQVEVCRGRGLDVIWTDWKNIQLDKDIQAKLYGYADVVTMWDTVEHYCPAKYRCTEKENQVHQYLFQTVEKCFKKDIPKGKAWTSCLHIDKKNMDVSFKVMWMNYILDKFHSGCYPRYENRALSKNAQVVGFKEVFEKNLTEDYYMTSVLNETHFGKHKFILTPYRILVLTLNMILDPNWIQRLYWFRVESWMYQFDSENIENSTMQLLWIMWERDIADIGHEEEISKC